ncbi:MAG: MFS transporter [Nanoarchaeota archaeon]|nr:MFS transporter [Nanoarchaeota archaeon]
MNAALQRVLRALTLQGALGNSSSSLVGTYLPALALARGATGYQIGLLTMVQSLASVLAQLPGAKLVDTFRSRKAIWLIGTAGQRLFWIPLILVAFLPLPEPITIILIASGCAQFMTMLKTPAWTSLVADLVPLKIRGRYFGHRNTISGIATVVVLSIGAFLVVWGFAPILVLALVLGFASLVITFSIPDLKLRRRYFYRPTFSVSWVTAQRSFAVNRNFYWFTVFTMAFTIGDFVARPYYAVYMLNTLAIGFDWYGIAVAVGFLAGILSQSYWGKMADRFGPRAILAVACILSTIVPLFWILAQNRLAILLLVAVDNFALAGIGLASFILLLGTSPHTRRTTFVARHTMASEAAIVIGTFVGGLVLLSGGWFLSDLHLIFLISAAVSAVALLALPFVKDLPSKRGDYSVYNTRNLFLELVAVSPVRSTVVRLRGNFASFRKQQFKRNERNYIYRARSSVW